jgi:hypothetical protein
VSAACWAAVRASWVAVQNSLLFCFEFVVGQDTLVVQTSEQTELGELIVA